MKNYKILIILIIPILSGIGSVAMRAAIGPYWLGPNNDPAYLYLVNALYILDGIVPRFVEHPGTPLMVLGAWIIKVFNMRLQGEALVENVFRDPEFYMNAMHYVLLGTFLLTLAALGWYALKKTGTALAAVLLQLPALVYLTLRSYGSDKSILPIIVNVDAEPVLITAVNLFLMCFLKLYYAQDEQSRSMAAVLFGLVCGFGTAMKITFLPMVLLPILLLKKWNDRVILAVSAVISFVFFTLPIVSRYGRTWEWVTNLITRNEQGSGTVGLHPQLYVSQIQRVLSENILLITIAITAFLIYKMFGIWQQRHRITASVSPAGYAFLVVVATVLSYFIIMPRHPAPHYMVPAVGLIGLIIFLLYEALAFDRRLKHRMFAVFVVLFVAARVAMAAAYQKDAHTYHHQIYEFSQMVYSKYKDCMICPYYRSSSPAFALGFGDENAGRLAYTKVLRKVYPGTYYFHYWSRMFHDGAKDISFSKLKQINPCVLIYGLKYHHDFKEGYWLMEKLEAGPTEVVYRVHTSVGEIAMQHYMLSRELLQRGEYKEALSYGLKAKALGLPHIDKYLQELEFLIRQLK